MKKNIYLIFLLSLFFVTSCALYKKPDTPDLKIPHDQLSWWEKFNEPQLNQLVSAAIKNNYSYKISLKNIEIADTYVTQNMSSLFPQVNINMVKSTGNQHQIAGLASYQLDLWNQIGNSVKQAEANKSVTEADSHGVKLTLISSVVNTYFQIKAVNSNEINLTQQLEVTQKIVRLNMAHYQSGLVDFSVLDQARNQVELIKTSINTLEKQKQILYNTLAYLLGESPESFNIKIGEGVGDFLIPSGLSSKMIANRPDVQDAYYQILSYGYLQKQTIANFLPSINLTGNYGYATGGAMWNYGIFATQFVFDFESRMSEYQRANYQYQAAILNYKNTVLNAFKEIDNALSSYKEDNEILRSSQNQYANLKDELALANSQYKSGLTDYSNYLTAKLNYLQSGFNLINQQLVVTQDITQVYVALGLE